MIENPPIIRDIRNIRKAISEKFGNDPDRYIDHLISSPKCSAGKLMPAEEKENAPQKGKTG